MKRAQFIVEPQVFIHHTAERSFIGPGSILMENGNILMAAPWGRPPTNFEQLAAKFPVPMFWVAGGMLVGVEPGSKLGAVPGTLPAPRE